MGKLRILSGKQICQILERYEFEIVGEKGSHIVMQKKIESSSITVPIPNHKEIKIGTLKSIIRQSRIPASEFEET
ncbi:MAG: hypothetical protein A2V66_13830 [Ignavibacteria bacterium RBG_13_36_8]|nr:MAG: hypothetical protein A2V66_13830 [Ignavibacteria bacterium RBG_13_36_8]